LLIFFHKAFTDSHSEQATAQMIESAAGND